MKIVYTIEGQPPKARPDRRKYRPSQRERDRRRNYTRAIERFGIRITPGWRHNLRRYRRMIRIAERCERTGRIAPLYRHIASVYKRKIDQRIELLPQCRVLIAAVKATKHPSRLSTRRVPWSDKPVLPEYGVARVIEKFHFYEQCRRNRVAFPT